METDQSFYDLAKRSVELEAQCDKLNKEKTMLMEEVMIEYTKAKNKCGETEAKLREEKEKCTQLEIDLKAAAADLEDKAAKISKLEEENKKLEEEITELSIRNAALKRQKHQSEMESEMDLEEQLAKEAKNNDIQEEEYNSLLIDKCFLEKEISRLRKDKLDEDERRCKVNNLLEAEKKRVAEMEGVVLGLSKKIESLERAKKYKQAKDAELINEKGKEIVRISNEKRLVEAKKRVYEEQMTKKVVALENHIKTLMEEESRRWMDKDKMISEREEAIKVLDRENEALEARNKELETELKTVKLSLVLKTEKEVGGISGAPQNKGNIKTEALSAYKRA